jgi:exopolyphosphatase / guanosine-5'-triphosphate,3'-diphosphate pyrophosphatase
MVTVSTPMRQSPSRQTAIPDRVSNDADARTDLVAVLDMGASAIRLVVAEIRADRSIRVIDEASRGVLLGRDTFSSGVIRARTIDAVVAALENFRELANQYGPHQVRAVATSAVREARNVDIVLDLIRARTGTTFEIVDEAEEARLLFLAVKQTMRDVPALQGPWTLIAEVGGGSTSLTLLRRGDPNRSGVYALGAIRLRQQLDLRRLPHALQLALLKRSIANVVDEIRLDIPLHHVTHVIAVGGDIRFAAAEMAQNGAHRDMPAAAFNAFCDEIERLDEERLVDRFRLAPVEAETLVPSLLVYRALLSETGASGLVVSEASIRGGILLDLAEPAERAHADDFHRQVLASAESVGHKHRFDRKHGRHVAMLAGRLFDDLRDDHGLSDRHRLLLEVAALLHDVGIYISLRAHHKHSQYLLAAAQIFGLANEDMAVVSNIARYHRRALPQPSHLPYAALDRDDRLAVNKLAAILRLANALDAEHLQKLRTVRLVRRDPTWILEIAGQADVTMEERAAAARADLFVETYGRELTVRSVSAAV